MKVVQWAIIVLVGTVTLGEDIPVINGQAQIRGHGEPCTCDSDCDFSKWLICKQNKCSCLSRTFKYDFGRQTCVVRLGQKCFEIAADYSQYKELPPSIRCVEGAFCSISAGGLCACNTYGYFESTDTQRCERKKELGESCQQNLECISDSCVETKCVCKLGQYFDAKFNKCSGLVDSYCFADDECTENAICNGYQGARCSCSKGYRETASKRCAKESIHGDSCDSSSPCNNVQLACIEGICQCAYPDHQIFHEESKTCKSLVGSAPCSHDDGCVENARCHITRGFRDCHCNSGYIEIEDGSCGKYSTLGGNCKLNTDCDPVTPLTCKDSKCQCKDSLTIFDPVKRICRGLHGFRNCKSDSMCVQNAQCVQRNEKLSPKCLCRPLHTPGVDRTCHLAT